MAEIIPQSVFKTRVRDENVGGDNPFRWQRKLASEIFLLKRIVLFALPGAFSPTCSSAHLLGYERHYDELKELGIDEVICLSVNDAFVMSQWGKQLGVKNVMMLPDGNGDFTRKMGMLVNKSSLGFGMRSWRYSMVVNNTIIEKQFIEPGFEHQCAGDPFEVSDVETMLTYLRFSAP